MPSSRPVGAAAFTPHGTWPAKVRSVPSSTARRPFWLTYLLLSETRPGLPPTKGPEAPRWQAT